MKKIKRWWKDFLDRMATAAGEEFGGHPPDCCSPASDPKNKEAENNDVERKAS